MGRTAGRFERATRFGPATVCKRTTLGFVGFASIINAFVTAIGTFIAVVSSAAFIVSEATQTIINVFQGLVDAATTVVISDVRTRRTDL